MPMNAKLCLITGLLTLAQLPGGPPASSPVAPPAAPRPARPTSGEWQIMPRLVGAQELVFRGLYSEQTLGGVQNQRDYRFELRAFVLDANPKGYEIALLTTLRQREARSGTGNDPASAARLEVVQLDLQGKLKSENPTALVTPLDGLPTCDTGIVVEVLRGGRVALDQTWIVAESDRPERLWKLAATEILAGGNCLKFVGVQQSEEWDQPRAGRTAWRRTDTVWINQRSGVASRVERIVE